MAAVSSAPTCLARVSDVHDALLPVAYAYMPGSSEVDYYPVCGLTIEEDGVAFCPHYGEVLLSEVERQPSAAQQRNG